MRLVDFFLFHFFILILSGSSQPAPRKQQEKVPKDAHQKNLVLLKEEVRRAKERVPGFREFSPGQK